MKKKLFPTLLILTMMTTGLMAQENMWGDIEYEGQPWVLNTSKPIQPTSGLAGRHVTIWASHGRYYDQNKGFWKWQRPNLFGTTEDLFTQTIVLPYLIPMLEKAGAVVFTPRERDWQKDEYIIDHDGGFPQLGTTGYQEDHDGTRWKDTDIPGFGSVSTILRDGENPFTAGKARRVKATKKKGKTYIKYQPNFRKAGRYAVYVSYQTLKKSIPDAHYIVFHQGQATEFRVNQRMGGGTWVYLGTFDFDQGDNMRNCVMITNNSEHKGYVTADAVRFGGGMGNIERGGMTSGMMRSLEGARYYAQWAGAPYSVYSTKGGQDDYGDDINVRSLMSNWVAGGSCFVPATEGLKVPIELSLAVHSDAGYDPFGESLIGSLAVCTTNHNDGRLGSGISRLVSKDFARLLLEGLVNDLGEYRFPRRYLWDRNYSETRLPEVPSAIIETMSHQSFPDMVLGQDPNFRFQLARSLYKTITRYVNDMHGTPSVIAPLTPDHFQVTLNNQGQAQLSWMPVIDTKEKTAMPTSYNLYIAQGADGYDNGRNLSSSNCQLTLTPGVMYRFRVTASNKGGESFPSEELCALYQGPTAPTILIVNGFNRLSAPAVINNSTQQGFDMGEDIGVSYGPTAGWAGQQICFDRSRIGKEGPDGMGYCGNELAGYVIPGNDFNNVATHAWAIASARTYNIVSCSRESAEQATVSMNGMTAVDLLLGLQKDNAASGVRYKTFTANMQNRLQEYTQSGGRLLVSGAYVGSDMKEQEEQSFLSHTLKLHYSTCVRTDTLQAIHGMGTEFDFYRQLNENHYAATHSDVISPESGAFCALQYSNNTSAAVAYDGNDYKCFTLGFPFECIVDKGKRDSIMRGILQFITK